MIAALRTGAWLTGARIQNRPLGTDFSSVYAAGTYVREGQAAALLRMALPTVLPTAATQVDARPS